MLQHLDTMEHARSDRDYGPATGTGKSRKNEKPESGEGWVKTSVSLRASTRRRLKTWAAAHDMRIQEVLEDALDSYLS